ncbi:MAG: ATP-binding protein [Bdellovibrio sp.]|jgi:two-component system sensor histidine kinase CpxA
MRVKSDHLLLRIFFTHLIAALVVIAVLFGTFRLLQPTKKIPEIVERHAAWYLQNLLKELGDSPTPEQMSAFEEKFLIQVLREGIPLSKNDVKFPTFKDIDEDWDDEAPSLFKFGHVNGYYFIELKQQTPRTVWLVSGSNFPKRFAFPIFWVLGFVVFIFAISFVSIRLTIRPVQYLLSGAEQLASGNLKFRMPFSKNGEFHRISQTFNSVAERLEKLVTSKELLLRDVSHDLRSPLTRIGVAAEMISQDDLKQSIKEDVKRVDHLIDQILESYNLRSGQLNLKKVPANICELLASLQNEYSKQKPTVLLDAPRLATAEFDPMMMERVFRNLIENAQKYSKPDSKPIELKVEDQGHDWAVTIKDYGSGISFENQKKVFDPFFRVDQARNPNRKAGFGLGLSISKAIIDAHGFSIELQTEIGLGTVVSVLMKKETSLG